MDFAFLKSSSDWTMLVHGIAITSQLAVLVTIGSVIVGLIGSIVYITRISALHTIVRVYVEFFRNTPPLAQIFFFYFGVGAVLPSAILSDGTTAPLLSNFQWAAVALIAFGGAFNVEIFRAGYEAIPSTLIEAAKALGYSRFGIFWRVELPLGLRVCLPALANNLVNVVKATDIAYTIGVVGVVYASTNIAETYFNYPTMMLILLVIYYILVGVTAGGLALLERFLKVPGYGK